MSGTVSGAVKYVFNGLSSCGGCNSAASVLPTTNLQKYDELNVLRNVTVVGVNNVDAKYTMNDTLSCMIPGDQMNALRTGKDQCAKKPRVLCLIDLQKCFLDGGVLSSNGAKDKISGWSVTDGPTRPTVETVFPCSVNTRSREL